MLWCSQLLKQMGRHQSRPPVKMRTNCERKEVTVLSSRFTIDADARVTEGKGGGTGYSGDGGFVLVTT